VSSFIISSRLLEEQNIYATDHFATEREEPSTLVTVAKVVFESSKFSVSLCQSAALRRASAPQGSVRAAVRSADQTLASTELE
jgi:hypothetical protein